MMFEPALVETLIVEGAEGEREAAQSPDQTELGDDNVDNETELCLPREFQSVLSFSLHVAKLIATCKEVGVQVVAAICRKGEVADSGCGIKGATHQLPPGSDVPGPGHDKIPKGHVGAGLIATQSTLLHQFGAEPAEP